MEIEKIEALCKEKLKSLQPDCDLIKNEDETWVLITPNGEEMTQEEFKFGSPTRTYLEYLNKYVAFEIL